MSESTLSTTRSEILQAVGDFLGHGRAQFVWTREQTAQITRIMRSGERQFYNPPGHSWSFLRLTLSLSISSGDGDYDLPDGFAGFLDQFLTFSSNTHNRYEPVRQTSVAEILRLRQNSNLNPAPQELLFAVNAKTPTGTTGQRFEVLIFPEPTASGTLGGLYYANADATTDTLVYAMGGGLHSETLLACCLAAAELERDKKPGALKQLYNERLAASIAHDRKIGAKTFGLNLDGGSASGVSFAEIRGGTLTYNGDDSPFV